MYKRAMTFVFLARYVLGYKTQSQWKKFSEADLKLNVRLFRRWSDKEDRIFPLSDAFQALPDDVQILTPVKRRLENTSQSDSPVKRVFVVGDDSTDDDE